MKKAQPAPAEKATRKLKHRYTTDELLEISREMAELARTLREAEDAKKAAASDWKARIDSLTTELDRCGRKIRDGHEFRDVECTIVLEEGVLRHLVRLDTGEEITETIPAHERQLAML